jgi:hypothetical protein
MHYATYTQTSTSSNGKRRNSKSNSISGSSKAEVQLASTTAAAASSFGAGFGSSRRGSTDSQHPLLPIAAAGPASCTTGSAAAAAVTAAAAAASSVSTAGVFSGVGVGGSRRPSHDSTGINMLQPLHETSCSSAGSRGLPWTTSAAADLTTSNGSRGWQRNTPGNAAAAAAAGDGDNDAGKDQAGSVSNNVNNNKQQLGLHQELVRAETWLVTVSASSTACGSSHPLIECWCQSLSAACVADSCIQSMFY